MLEVQEISVLGPYEIDGKDPLASIVGNVVNTSDHSAPIHQFSVLYNVENGNFRISRESGYVFEEKSYTFKRYNMNHIPKIYQKHIYVLLAQIFPTTIKLR